MWSFGAVVTHQFLELGLSMTQTFLPERGSRLCSNSCPGIAAQISAHTDSLDSRFLDSFANTSFCGRLPEYYGKPADNPMIAMFATLSSK